MLVVLRLSLGFHFLYEGLWKVKHRDFSAAPFLTQAKGPAAPLFYAMINDLDGRQRLAMETDAKSGKKTIPGKMYLTAWGGLKSEVAEKYKLDAKQKKTVDAIYGRYAAVLESYLKENADEIVAHFGSLDRFEESLRQGNNGAEHQKKRIWDRRMELRKEAGGWLTELDKLTDSYKQALWATLTPQQRAMGDLPEHWTQADLMDFAVKYGLSAIGLCLLVGFCTRLAAIGGGCFMISVLLTQPPWPTIYPPAPEVVGHALLVDKNFVEMVALFLVATTAVGRWAGLDYFLYHFVGRRVEAYFAQKV